SDWQQLWETTPRAISSTTASTHASLHHLQRAGHHDARVRRHTREVRREFLVEDDGFLGGRRVQQSHGPALVPVAEPRVRAIETVDRRGHPDDVARHQARLGGRHLLSRHILYLTGVDLGLDARDLPDQVAIRPELSVGLWMRAHEVDPPDEARGCRKLARGQTDDSLV